jgi:sugar/nucleoside kinase (ribokinase family)
MAVRWDVIGVGCNSVDYVYRVPASPQADSPTAKQRISSHQVTCGGQMATAMAACGALGLRAAYLGSVGNDHHGRLIVDELRQRGIDVSQVQTRECANRFAVITVDESSGDRMVLWDRDERLNLHSSDIAAALVGSARVVHVDDEDQDAAIAAAEIAGAAGVLVTGDIERVTDRTKRLIGAVSVPVFAQHLLPAITGERDPETALRAIRVSHQGILCVTLGAGGAMMLAGDELIAEPAFTVAAVDTTGAGDVFRAALIYGLLHDYQPRQMLRFANAAAALACTRMGAIAGVPALVEVNRLVSGGSALR